MSKVKTIGKYLLLLLIAIVLGEIYSLIVNAGFNFEPITSGQLTVVQFFKFSFKFETVFMFVACFFYMVFFLKFLTRLFK